MPCALRIRRPDLGPFYVNLNERSYAGFYVFSGSSYTMRNSCSGVDCFGLGEFLKQPGECRIAPGDVICPDITYIPVSGRYFYLVAVMDWASRYVLSWELGKTIEVGLKRERAEAPRSSLDLGHRPREPVHERGVPRRPAGGGGADQHGWPGSMDRQQVHRAVVALAEAREGVPGGSEGRAPSLDDLPSSAPSQRSRGLTPRIIGSARCKATPPRI